MPYILEEMVPDDIREVAAIERLCFSMPWPTSAYRRELKTPETNRYIVARFIPPEIAAKLSLAEPTVANLTSLVHPELAPPTNGKEPPPAKRGGRSLLATLLPWLRTGENGRTEA